MGYYVSVTGFTGDFEYVNGNYTFVGIENGRSLYRNGEEGGDTVLYVGWSSELNLWGIFGDVNGTGYDFAILQENVKFPWLGESWVVAEPYTVYDENLDEDIPVIVTGENITITSQYNPCTTLTDFNTINSAITGLNNLQWAPGFWDSLIVDNASIIKETQYLQIWFAENWQTQQGLDPLIYILVGPKLSGDPVYEIYKTVPEETFSGYTLNLTEDSLLLTSSTITVSGTICPNNVTWSEDTNLQFVPFAFTPPSLRLPLPTFEQVANRHGGIAEFLRLRNLGYF